MKKYKRQPDKFEVFDLFSSLGPEWNLQFNETYCVCGTYRGGTFEEMQSHALLL